MLMSFSTICLMAVNSANADPINNLGNSFLHLTVDDEAMQLPLVLNQEGTGFNLSDGGLQFSGAEIVGLDFSGLFDPIVSLGLGVVDFGAPSDFGVAIVAPLSPQLSGLLTSTFSLEGTVTDGGQDGASITPFGGSHVGKGLVNATDVVNAGPAVTYIPDAGGPFLYGPYTDSATYDPVSLLGGPATSFGITVGFTGSGGGDSYSLASTHSINPVPEPASMLLIGTGLIGLAVFGRRLRK
jgi:hypothetical protein